MGPWNPDNHYALFYEILLGFSFVWYFFLEPWFMDRES